MAAAVFRVHGGFLGSFRRGECDLGLAMALILFVVWCSISGTWGGKNPSPCVFLVFYRRGHGAGVACPCGARCDASVG